MADMTRQVPQLPLLGTIAGFRRFRVAEYHRLIELGLLTEQDRLELLEGYLVLKMTRNPPHDSALHRTLRQLYPVLPPDWEVRIPSAITLAESEPEPDLAVVRKDPNDYSARHPQAAQVGLVIEVADSTLAGDRVDKGRICARAGIPTYWILNLVEKQVELYTDLLVPPLLRGTRSGGTMASGPRFL